MIPTFRILVGGLAAVCLCASAAGEATPLTPEEIAGAERTDGLSIPMPGEFLSSLNKVGKTHEGWQLLSMAIDSGAAETIIPHRLVSQHPLRETNASRGGLCFSSATGQPIPNLGEQRLP